MSAITSASVSETPDVRSVARASSLRRALSTTAAWILVLDVLLLVAFGFLSDGLIWTPNAIQSMLLGSTEGLLLALGLALMMGAGAFDLSVGSNLVVSSVVAMLVINAVAGGNSANLAASLAFGVASAVIAGGIFGAVNGYLIAYRDINSLIATLATSGIGLGAALVISGGSDVSGLPVEIQRNFGQAALRGVIPLPTLIAAIAAIALGLVLRFTRYGTATLAIGSSLPAARRAGIRVKSHLLGLAALMGVLAGVAGFIDISRYGSTAIQGHNLDGLAAVTAVVIGGTALTGGRVSIVGVVAGAMLAVILQTGLIVIGVQSFYQTIAIGVVLLIAVGIDRYREKRRSS